MASSTFSGAVTGSKGTQRKMTAAKKRREKDHIYLTKLQKDLRERRPMQTQDRPGCSIVQKRLKQPSSEVYQRNLRKLSTEPLTTKQIQSINEMTNFGSPWLGCVGSRTDGEEFGVKKAASNGDTASDLMIPEVFTRYNECPHMHLHNNTQGDVCCPMFLMIHALGRYHKGQKDTSIRFFDSRRAKTSEGKPASFFHALGLYKTFDLPNYPCFQGRLDHIRNHPRKFTQEYLVHNAVLIDDKTTCAANIKDLIADGLYEIFPAFYAPPDHKRAGLYEAQVAARISGYLAKKPEIYSYEKCLLHHPIDADLLKLVRKVTLNFVVKLPGVDLDSVQPPLNVSLMLLTFEKWPDHNPVLMDWIMNHYTKQDVAELYLNPDGSVCRGITHVANNLTSFTQYLDLLRECIALFDLPPLPENVVETQNEYHDPSQHRDFTYKESDAKYCSKARIYESEPFDPAKDAAQKEEAESTAAATKQKTANSHAVVPMIVISTIAQVGEDCADANYGFEREDERTEQDELMGGYNLMEEDDTSGVSEESMMLVISTEDRDSFLEEDESTEEDDVNNELEWPGVYREFNEDDVSYRDDDIFLDKEDISPKEDRIAAPGWQVKLSQDFIEARFRLGEEFVRAEMGLDIRSGDRENTNGENGANNDCERHELFSRQRRFAESRLDELFGSSGSAITIGQEDLW